MQICVSTLNSFPILPLLLEEPGARAAQVQGELTTCGELRANYAANTQLLPNTLFAYSITDMLDSVTFRLFWDLKSRLCCNNNQQSSNLSCVCVNPVSSLTPLLIFSGLHPLRQGAKIHQSARKEREGMERDISRPAPSTLLHLHPCCDARYETWLQNQGQTTISLLY